MLDRDEWAVFERVGLDGMSYGAAARDLGRNASGVRRRYLRAIRKVNRGLRFPSVVRERVEWRRNDPRAERRFRLMCGDDG